MSSEPLALAGHLSAAHGLAEPEDLSDLDAMLAPHQVAIAQNPSHVRATCALFLPGAGQSLIPWPSSASAYARRWSDGSEKSLRPTRTSKLSLRWNLRLANGQARVWPQPYQAGRPVAGEQAPGSCNSTLGG